MLEKIKNLPKIYVFILIIIFLLFGGLYSYFSSKTSETQESQATPTPLLTFAPVEISPTPTPVSTPSPTPKSTSTPTPTPKTSPTPTLVSQTKTLTAPASLDGFRSSNGGGNASVDIRAGRNVNLVSRGFVSFDLGSLPTGAVIEKATLRLYQTSVVTGDPYGIGGALKVDHLDYGSSLEDSDYGAPSISASFTTLTQNSVVEWKDANVSDSVKNDLVNNRTRSQFRIHFQIETTGGDILGDFAHFESADNSQGTGNTPQLVVKYH